MNTNPERVNKNSATWIGFQHALLSLVLIYVFIAVFSLGAYFFGLIESFVTYIYVVSVSSMVLGVVTSGAVLFSLLKKHLTIQEGSLLNASLIWFVGFLVVIELFSVFVSGATPGMLSLIINIAVFYLVSWVYLRK